MTIPPHFSLSRRLALLTASSFLVSACSETIDSASESFGLIVGGQEGAPISRDKVNSIPYASIAAKIGKGPRSLIILGKVYGDNLHWITADRKALVTRNGRLVQTAGLQANLRRSQLLDDDPLSGPLSGPLSAPGADAETAAALRFRRLLDFDQPQRYGIMIASRFQDLGPESLVIAELEWDTRHVRETCTAREIDWSFQNDYWIDRQYGLVWKSVQHFHPEMPPVVMELLKPPAR